MSAVAPSPSPYAFGHEEAELRRLQAQSPFFDPLTRLLLRDAGIGPGMRVLDIGCGAGDVSMLVAELVGDAGEVIGVDRAAPPLHLAERRARERGISRVRFQQGDEHAAAALAAERPFDAVVGRCVLLHQRAPVEFVRALAAAVRPGGIVAFQDPDFSLFLHAHPAVSLLDDVRRWILAGHALIHAPSSLSLHTPGVFRAAGLPLPQQRLHCPVLAEGQLAVCQIASGVIRTMLPLLLDKGVVDAATVDIDTLATRMHAALQEQGSVLQTISMAECWARLPE